MMTMNNVTAPNTPEPARPSVPFSIRTSERPVRYSLEFQRRVVREYLSGETKDSLCEKYSITLGIINTFLRKHREEVSQEMEQDGAYIAHFVIPTRMRKGLKSSVSVSSCLGILSEMLPSDMGSPLPVSETGPLNTEKRSPKSWISRPPIRSPPVLPRQRFVRQSRS